MNQPALNNAFLQSEEGNLPRPIGLVWGGTVNHGRLKLRDGAGPENWTSGIGLARLLDLLDVDLVTSLDQRGPGTVTTALKLQRHFAISLVCLSICCWLGGSSM